jgi:hypothetical protein
MKYIFNPVAPTDVAAIASCNTFTFFVDFAVPSLEAVLN